MTALVVRGRASSCPAVLAAASVIVHALPVPAVVRLGAVAAGLGVAACLAFRR